jgi:hypothetical protein
MGNYKYYKLSVYDPDNTILNITFEITPLHGDSDLFISRNESVRFPNKTDYDIRSIRIGSNADHAEFGRTENNTIEGTYYVGIYGFTYASYSIVANIIRIGAVATDTN